MKTKMILTTAGIALFLVATQTATAAPPDKWFEVEGRTVNSESSFMLRVDVDKPDRVYHVGEQMTVRVRPERDCYLYLLYYSAGDRVACLFPNKYQKNNQIRAGQVVSVPSADAEFQFTASPPVGQEVLQVIGTLTPVDMFGDKDLTGSAITPLETTDLKDMVVELKGKKKQRNWAEARIQITTVSGDQPPSTPGGKRLAVCVGISEYKSERVPRLQVSHKDAERMATALRTQCRVDDVTLLTNSQATREAIEKAIFQDLVAKTGPGDTVFIFFSCHGGRAADVNGDEQDGFDEYLVPYDGEMGKPETMILDDVFSRWVRELDGRKIAIVLDNCYSGGASKRAKGLGDRPSSSEPLDFFDGEVKRAKDLGQKGTMVLAACQANQLAWEMSSDDQGSVLTYNILKTLSAPEADQNGDGQLSIGEVYRYIQKPVQDYVRATFTAEQTPVLLDNADDTVILRP